MQLSPKPTSRYFTFKPGTNECGRSYDVVSSLTGDLIAILPYCHATAQLVVDALNVVANCGGEIWTRNLDKAQAAMNDVDLTVDSTVKGSPWTIKQVIDIRPDLTTVEAFGVLHEVECFVNAGMRLCPCDVEDLADATFPLVRSVKHTEVASCV